MSFQPAQRQVEEWIDSETEGYFSPMMMLARMTEELGEIARVISHIHGEKIPKAGESVGNLAAELGDLLFVLVCMANREGIDLDESWKLVMEKLYVRDAGRWKRASKD